MTQDIYNSIREILLCDEDIDFYCKLLLKITFDCNEMNGSGFKMFVLILSTAIEKRIYVD